MRNDAGPVPILVAGLAILLLCIMDGIIKGLAPHYPTSTIVLMRFLFGGVVALAVYLAAGAPRIERETLVMGAVRAVFILATTSLVFIALGLMPLAEVIALSFVSPIILALFGRVFLGERIAPGVVVGIALSAVGTLAMLADQLTVVRSEPRSLLGVLAILGSTVTHAASQILLRARAHRDPLSAAVLLQTWLPAALVAPLAGASLRFPELDHLTAFAVVGVLGTAGHLLLTWAFARASAARLGVVQYTAFAWGALIGYVWFSEVPTAATWIGTAFIVSGAFAVAHRRRSVAPRPATSGTRAD